MRSALSRLGEGEFTEGHQLPANWRVPNSTIGRRLSQTVAKRLLAKFDRGLSRQTLRTSKAANAAALTNTVAIIANERTYITLYSNARNIDLPRGLQWLQRITMSEGAGPSSEERHCADADGDHRFSYDEEPQRRQKHEEAAYDDDCRLSRETFRCG